MSQQKTDLRTARFYRKITQPKLTKLTGVNQGRISQAENGLLALNASEKTKIEKALGSICWKSTESGQGQRPLQPPEINFGKIGVNGLVAEWPDSKGNLPPQLVPEPIEDVRQIDDPDYTPQTKTIEGVELGNVTGKTIQDVEGLIIPKMTFTK